MDDQREQSYDRLWAAVDDHLMHYGRDFSRRFITRASGAYLYDQDDRPILDFASGQMCATLGHNHPAIVAAMAKAGREVIHLDSTKLSPAVAELARTLCELLPPTLQKAIFLNTGGESNEAALRIAKLVTGGFEVIGFTGSWHGTTAGAGASTYAHGRRGYGPALPGAIALPAPNAYRCPIAHCRELCDRTCLEAGFRLFDSQSVGAGAAVIIEPIQSAGGIIVPPPGYLARLGELCQERGMLLIFDEAQTGLGRVGATFAVEQAGVVPDILTLSKTLGGGLPLAATVTGPEIAADCRAKGFSHYTSHVSDPLTAEVGLAVLGVLITDRLAERAESLGGHLKDGLQALQQRYQSIGDIRGRGLLVGVELVTDRESRTPADGLLAAVTARCLELGLNLNKAGLSGSVWRIAPPLTISRDELESGLAMLDQALRDCEVP